ncbi:unnamed protein product, partial [Meganyctiphanes norvegica]
MKDFIKEDNEDNKTSNTGGIESLKYSKNLIEFTNPQFDRWKMHSPQSHKEEQNVEKVDSEGDSDEITYLCTTFTTDPLDIKNIDPEPEKKVNFNKRKNRRGKGKISYDEDFTDDSDDNLHLHLDSESDLEARSFNRNQNKRKKRKYKESSDVGNLSSDSDIELVVREKSPKNKHSISSNISGKRTLTDFEVEFMKKLKNEENIIKPSEWEPNKNHSININVFKNNEIDKDIQLQEFWAKPDVADIFLNVKNEDMTIQTASEILGYSSTFIYQRYKEIFLNKNGNHDEVDISKPWFMYKRYVQQFVSSSVDTLKCSNNNGRISSTVEPVKRSNNNGRTSFRNGNKFSDSVNNNMISEIASLPGWKRQLTVRQNGATAGNVDVYYINPHGKKLRSIPMVIDYCKKEGIQMNLSAFDFNRPNLKRNKKTRKIIEYETGTETSESEKSEQEYFQRKKSERTIRKDRALLSKYNIKKCVKIILHDCKKSKNLFNSEINGIEQPKKINGVRPISTMSFQEEFMSRIENNDNIESDNIENIKSKNNDNIKCDSSTSLEAVDTTFEVKFGM